MLRIVVALTILLAWAAPAAAQTAPNALAQQLIAEGDATGVFEALPSERRVVVRHPRSGLVCRLAPDNRNRLIIFPQAARGEDVACDSTDGAESITLYATRFSFETSLDELMAGAAAAIRQRFPDARELAPIADAADAAPASRSAHFAVTRADDGALMYTRVSIAFVGPWAIKLRYSIVTPDPEAVSRAEAAAAAIWSSALQELTPARP